MSIFNHIFIYFYFQEIFAVIGETLEISLFPIDHHSFLTVRIFEYCLICRNHLNYLQGGLGNPFVLSDFSSCNVKA